MRILLYIFILAASGLAQVITADDIKRAEERAKKPVIIPVFVPTPTTTPTPKASPTPTKKGVCLGKIFAHYDKMTASTMLTSVPFTLSSDGKTGINFSIIGLPKKRDSATIFALKLLGPGGTICAERNAGIILLFRDGTRRSISSGKSEFDCEGRVPIYFGGMFNDNASLFDDLKTRPLETIRVNSYRGYFQEDFSANKAIEFMTQMSCMAIELTAAEPQPQ